MENLTQEQIDQDAAFDAECSDEPEIYDVSCVVTVRAKHPEWATDSARRRLGSSGMGHPYIARRRYQGPLNEDQQRAVARYLLDERQAETIVENCVGFPEQMFGGADKTREAVAEFIRHLREEEIGA